MNLTSLDWSEAETGGALKSTHSLATARFSHSGRPFVALEWYHRTGHLFAPYTSLILIAEECDKTADAGLLRSIALGAKGVVEDGVPRVVESETLGRKVLVIAGKPDREAPLDAQLDGIL